MTIVSVFSFGSYKAFIKAWIVARPARGRGEKSKIAAALHCHSAYISQVLEHNAQLSLEQASALAEYMGLSSQETHFLLLLIQHERAGTKLLKKLFDSQIREILDARTLLRHRLEDAKSLTEKDQATYYSSWLYAAAHMAISLPLFNNREALAQKLDISPQRAAEILDFLVSVGLAVEEGGRFRSGTASIYLPENSPLISKHHVNWRLQALRSMDKPRPHDLHYSSVVTLNQKDLPKIREIMVKAIEEIRTVVRASKNEDALFSFSLDAFGL